MVAGHGRAARAPRLQARRAAQGRALPGQAWVVDAPAPGLGTEGWPWENGPAQERALFGPLRKTVEAGELWMEARHVGPRALRGAIPPHGACCLPRAHRGLPYAMVEARGASGRTEPGRGAQPRGAGGDQQGQAPVFRRVRLTLQHATRAGATRVHLLPHFPPPGSATRGADVSRQRWPVAPAFPPLAASLPSASHPFGYPQAAWCGFGLALGASNGLAVGVAALRGGHGAETGENDVA
jgi:hypothetical protein